MDRELKVGAAVVFITSQRERVNALVTCVHGAMGKTVAEHVAMYGNLPCINVVYLAPDPKKDDQYGRQKEHASSVSHGSVQGEPQGYCWLWPDEA